MMNDELQKANLSLELLKAQNPAALERLDKQLELARERFRQKPEDEKDAVNMLIDEPMLAVIKLLIALNQRADAEHAERQAILKTLERQSKNLEKQSHLLAALSEVLLERKKDKEKKK
ncbi:MAG: hypothetical protein HY22_10440 [[Candidatus Thermochlorobacteriaceae] bacterium GBChlB]|jgi:hypothetical protein|nr:MAG: hypothetical protein HY22_10440 [[Candidatus Thermochlorobacteriaceae] bacterium GBChlB]